MPSGKSAYLRNQVLNHVLGATTYTPPGTIYIALSTASWAAATTGTTLAATEPSGANGYARVALTNNGTTWSTATSGSKSNSVDVLFSAATGNWGTLNSFYVVDASSNGNILYGGDLYVPRAILSGDTAKFLVGQLTVTEA